MRTGKSGLDIIKEYEQLRLKAYIPVDRPGTKNDDVPTIGWGHTKDVQLGDTCTEEQADAWLREDVACAEKAINKLVRVPLTQKQFDALSSLVFNIGEPQFRGSTLLRMLNKKDYLGAGNQFPRWKYDNGEVMPGLLKRRKQEKALFEGQTK